MVTVGLLAAILAMLSWSIGDYSIDKATDRIGDWKTLFFIGLGSIVGLTLFIWEDILRILSNPSQLYALILLSLVSVVAALLMVEGLKIGKLSVIAPVFGVELPATIALSIFLGGEHLSLIIYALSAMVFVGIILAATVRDRKINWHKLILEKGVILAAVGATGMGLMNFLIGTISRGGSPVVTIWFMHSFLGIVCFTYLLLKGEVKNLFRDLKNHTKYILAVTVFDNLAWIAYAFALVILPIAIATTISSGYIALTVLLGVFLNKEKIQKHQIAGVILVVVGIISLSYLVEY